MTFGIAIQLMLAPDFAYANRFVADAIKISQA
jgi:hypothetical protein